jgi:hypothetical protein
MKEDRASPPDALELIAWHLNYFPGQSLSINEISNATGLAWATVRKYTQLLALLEQVAPRVRIVNGKANLEDRNPVMGEFFQRPLPAVALYVLLHAKARGDPLGGIDYADHGSFASQYNESLKKLVELGLAEQNGRMLRLTPAGAALADDARLEILTHDVSQQLEPQAPVRYITSPTDTGRRRTFQASSGEIMQ